MKRKCMSAILSAVILLSVLPQMAFTAAAAKAKTLGDVNADGAVNVSDGVALSRYVAQWDDITVDKHAADLNQDGVIKKQDVTILVRYLAGWDGYDKYIQPIKTDIPDSLHIETQPKAVNTTADKLTPISAAAAGGTEPYTYQWLRNGIEIADATDAAYTPKICGDYRCMITDSEENAVMTHVAKADITPVISKQPTSNEIYPTISVISGDTFTYLWQFRAIKTEEWVDLEDSDKATYKPDKLGYYRCIVTNDTDGKQLISDEVMNLAGEDFGKYSSIVLDMPEGAVYGEEMDFGAGLSMNIQTGELPPTAPYAVTGFYGDTITLRADVFGIGPFTYEWQIADTYKDYIDGTNFRILDDKTDGCTGQGTSVLNYVLSDYDNSDIICDEAEGMRTNGFIRCKVTDGVGNVAYVEYENKWNFDYNQWTAMTGKYGRYSEYEFYLDGARGLELCGIWDHEYELPTPDDLTNPVWEMLFDYMDEETMLNIGHLISSINTVTGKADPGLAVSEPGEYRLGIPFSIFDRYRKPEGSEGVDGTDYFIYYNKNTSQWYNDHRSWLYKLSDPFRIDYTRTFDYVITDFDPTDKTAADKVLNVIAQEAPEYAGLDADTVYGMLPLRIYSGYTRQSLSIPGTMMTRYNFNLLDSDAEATEETAYSAAIESYIEDEETFAAVKEVIVKDFGCTEKEAAAYIREAPCGLPNRTDYESALALVNELREAGADAHLLYLRDRMPEQFSLGLNSYSVSKVQAMKVLHEQLGIGLTEAQTLVETVPCVVLDDLTERQAKLTAETLEAEGLSVTMILSAKMTEPIKGTRVTLLSYDQNNNLKTLSALKELLGIDLTEAQKLLAQTPFILYADADETTVLNAASKLVPLGAKLLYAGAYRPCTVETSTGVGDKYIISQYSNASQEIQWMLTLSNDEFDGQKIFMVLEQLKEDGSWKSILGSNKEIKDRQLSCVQIIKHSITPPGTYRMYAKLPNGYEAEEVFTIENTEEITVLSQSGIRSSYRINPEGAQAIIIPWKVQLSSDAADSALIVIEWQKKLSTGDWMTADHIETILASKGDTLSLDYKMSTRADGEYRFVATYCNGFQIVSPTTTVIVDSAALKIEVARDSTYTYGFYYTCFISGGTVPELLKASLYVDRYGKNRVDTSYEKVPALKEENGVLIVTECFKVWDPDAIQTTDYHTLTVTDLDGFMYTVTIEPRAY